MSIPNEPIYSEWQEHLITQFQFNLLNIALRGNGNNIFLYNSLFTPIRILEMPELAKDILLRFEAETIHDIINDYTDKDFTDDTIFRNIVDFQAAWKPELLEASR